MEQPPQQPNYPPASQPLRYPQYPQQSSPLNYPQYPPPSQPLQYPQYPQQTSYPPYPQQGPQYPHPAMYVAPPQPVYIRNTSFTGKAAVAYLLYWVGYIPGLIFNIMFLNEANNIKKETGRTPEGMGCLWATLIGSLSPAVGFLGICLMMMLAGALSSGH